MPKSSVVSTENLTKGRHNLTISPNIWHILTELKRIQGTSVGGIIEYAVKKMIKDENINSSYFKIMQFVPFCDEKENEELTKILDSLTEGDMEVCEEYEL